MIRILSHHRATDTDVACAALLHFQTPSSANLPSGGASKPRLAGWPRSRKVASAIAAVELAPFGEDDDDNADRRAKLAEWHAHCAAVLSMLIQAVLHASGRRELTVAGDGGPDIKAGCAGRRCRHIAAWSFSGDEAFFSGGLGVAIRR
jgi:hypothetical protein